MKRRDISKHALLAVYILMICLTLFYRQLPIPENLFGITDWFFYVVFASSIPMLFMFSKNKKADRLLGDLSYAVYITHFFIIKLMINTKLFIHLNIIYTSLFAIAATLCFSYLLTLFIEKPIDRYRQLRLKHKKEKNKR
jgi:peptidoglycan/LPS O-acetylase OafA/YrhL